VAIEGVIRQEKLETSQLAVDTHGYTDFAMSHARLLGFDLCPRLKELKQRHLFVPRGTKVPAEIAAVCEANVDVALIEKHWDSLVHLAASVMSGHASAVAALARFGSAAQGDPIWGSRDFPSKNDKVLWRPRRLWPPEGYYFFRDPYLGSV